MKKLAIIFGALAVISFTGLPTALAVFIWTVAIPFMQQLESMP